MYTEDNRGRLPHGWFEGLSLLRGSCVSEDYLRLNPVDTNGIACCPMAVRPRNGRPPLGSTFEAWEDTQLGPPFRGSYGWNKWLLTKDFDSSIQRRPDIFSLRGRAGIPALLDSTRPSEGTWDNLEPPMTEDDGRWPLGWRTFCINRHDGHINGLFLDWSVRRIGLKELWTLKWNLQFDTANEWTKAGGMQPEDWPEWMKNFKDY